MPSSFTKWKSDAPTTKKSNSVFQDSSGNPIPSSSIDYPSYINYHLTPAPSEFSISTTTTNTSTFSPSIDGDLSSYPWGSNGQALSPIFTVETLSTPFLCGGTALVNVGTPSNISVDASSGVVTILPGVLTNISQNEYCIKMGYKTPTTTNPGYTYAYLYGILKIRALSPVSTLDYQNSSHILLRLSSVLDLDQFVKGSTITASPSQATATVVVLSGNDLYATVNSPSSATSSFRVGDSLSVSGGASTGVDAIVENVYNIFTPATILSVPNVLTKPLTTTASLAANGVTFTLTSPAASPLITLGSLTGSLTAAISTHKTEVSYVIHAVNDLGESDITYNAIVANAYYPPEGNGELLYPQSATLSVHARQIDGDLGDYIVGNIASTSYGGTATIIASGADPTDEDSLYLTLSLTATGSYGFHEGMDLLAGTSTMTLETVTEIYPISLTANIFGFGNVAESPYWSLGNTDSNPYTFTASSSAVLPSSFKFNTTTGLISGYTKNPLSTVLSITATNDFGTASRIKRMTFASSTIVFPTSLTYTVTSPSSSCTSRAEFKVSGFTSSKLSGSFTVGNKIRAKSGAIATITYIDDSAQLIYGDIGVGSSSFSLNEDVDNKSSGSFSMKGTITDIVYIFEKNVPLNSGICAGQITTTIVPSAAVVTSSEVAPSLPTGLTLDSTTATLGGTPTALSPETDYNLSVTNSGGSAITTMTFRISEKPRGLSYTHQVLLELDSSNISTAYIGAPISSDSMTSNGTGVIRDVSGSYVLVDVQTGYFEVGSNVDTHQFYYDYMGTIKTIKNNSLAVNLSSNGAPSPTVTATGSILYTGTGASTDTIAVVNYWDSAKAYVRLVQGSFSVSSLSAGGVPQGRYYCAALASSDLTALPACTAANSYYATSMSSAVVSLTRSTGAAFAVTTGDNLFAIQSTQTATVSLKNITSTDFETLSYNYLEPGSTVYRESSTAITQTDVGQIAPIVGAVYTNPIVHSDTFLVYQGQDVTIAPEVLTGENVVYSISPSFPVGSGLTFTPATGVISGTVGNSTALNTYTVTASNTLGTATKTFKLQGIRHFGVSVKMTDSPSVFIHRAGVFNKTAPCRVSLDQISANNSNDINNDIMCIVEGGELDFKLSGLEMSLFSGKSMCDQVSYTPYYFNAFPVATTATSAYSVECGCTITTADAALAGGGGAGYYSCTTINAGSWSIGSGIYDTSYNVLDAPTDLCQITTLSDGSTLPCDLGAIDVTKMTYIDDPDVGKCLGRLTCDKANCANIDSTCGGTTATGTVGTWVSQCKLASSDTDPVECGGDRFQCIGGAYGDSGLDSAALAKGINTQVMPAINGIDNKPYTIASPTSEGRGTNLKITNFTQDNSCGTGYTYYANGWEDYAAAQAMDASPWGDARPFYTFRCLDSAGTQKARIRIMVREWNMMYAFTDFLDKMIDPAATMDGAGSSYHDWDSPFLAYPNYSVTASNTPALINCTNTASPTGTGYSFPGEAY